MDAQQFAYWLQGFAELSGDTPPTEAQWKSIREHLGLVFKKVTPPVRTPLPTEVLLPNILDGLRWPPQGPAVPNRLPPYTVECKASNTAGMGTFIC